MKRLLLTFCLVVLLFVLGRVWNAVAASSGQGAGVATCPAGTVNGNVNGDTQLDISDAVYLLNFLFSGGQDPCAIAGGGIPTELEQLRLVSPSGDPGRLLFGPTDDCSISVDSSGPAGLLLRDPRGIRVLNPDPTGPLALRFGPTDDCSVGIDPVLSGLLLRDPGGIRIHIDKASPILRFGPTDDCSIGIDPASSGLFMKDVGGVRLLAANSATDPVLRFGPTDDCSIGIDAKHKGIILRDPAGVRAMSPDPDGPSTIIFGPTDDCTIGIDPKISGFIMKDVGGARVMSPSLDADPVLRFGPTDDCSIGIDSKHKGLILRDPSGIRILPPPPIPGAESLTRILFGPTDDCSIGIDPAATGGLILRDPRGIRITSQTTVDGPVFAQAFIQTSSRKLKEDIRTIDRPLEILKKLRGVAFQWKEELGGKEDVGFIAEEVAEALPLGVAPAAADGSPGVNYAHVVAVAVEGIKDQDEKIHALEKENEALRAKLGGLEARLAALARQVERLAPGEARKE